MAPNVVTPEVDSIKMPEEPSVIDRAEAASIVKAAFLKTSPAKVGLVANVTVPPVLAK